jgi:hypothetical protein
MSLARKKYKPEPLSIPKEAEPVYVLTNSGVFAEGNLVISRNGCVIGTTSISAPESRGLSHTPRCVPCDTLLQASHAVGRLNRLQSLLVLLKTVCCVLYAASLT